MDIIYLVTGATGHLGNAVVNRLVEKGFPVRALTLPDDAKTACIPKEAVVFKGNVVDKDSLYPFFCGLENKKVIVIHTAGIVSISSKSKKPVYDVNVNGTKNIIALCRAKKVEKLIYISSVHALEEGEAGKIIDESCSFNAKNVVGLYAKTKAEATKLVFQAISDGLEASIIFPTGICGPFDHQNGHFTQLLVDYCKGKLIAGVKGGYDFVDVRDVAEGIILCSEKGKKGESYILSNRYLEIPEIFQTFHKITGGKEIKLFLPLWFAKYTARLSETYYKILKQPPLYTAYSIYTLQTHSNFSHAKASCELGYTTRPFEETIKDTFEWLKRQNRI